MTSLFGPKKQEAVTTMGRPLEEQMGNDKSLTHLPELEASLRYQHEDGR